MLLKFWGRRRSSKNMAVWCGMNTFSVLCTQQQESFACWVLLDSRHFHCTVIRVTPQEVVCTAWVGTLGSWEAPGFRAIELKEGLFCHYDLDYQNNGKWRDVVNPRCSVEVTVPRASDGLIWGFCQGKRKDQTYSFIENHGQAPGF